MAPTSTSASSSTATTTYLPKVSTETPKKEVVKEFLIQLCVKVNLDKNNESKRRGNDGLIHLLIGRYRMEVDVRTRGGYTPLMLAAAHKRDHVYNLLLNPYGANPNLRDYSGKKAEHYLDLDEDKDLVDGAADLELEGKRKKIRKIPERSSTFIRDFVRESIRSSHKRPKSSFSWIIILFFSSPDLLNYFVLEFTSVGWGKNKLMPFNSKSGNNEVRSNAIKDHSYIVSLSFLIIWIKVKLIFVC